MPSASPWKAYFLLNIKTGRRPLYILAPRQRREIARTIEEETEGVGGESG